MNGSASSLSGKVAMVTGANTGIGAETAKGLARLGARVILACRSEEKTLPVIEQIRGEGHEAEFLALDLGDLAQVSRAASTFLDSGTALHILVNNAGLAGARGQTKDGFELAFGTNHLGHFLWTTEVLPLLRKAGAARIVNVSSRNHYRVKGIDYDAVQRTTASLTGMHEYGVSKLANVLFTQELAKGKAGQGVKSYCLHPGVVASDIWRKIPWPLSSFVKLFMVTNTEGAKTSLYCATSSEVAEHDGRYYDACKERKPNRVVADPEPARVLWERSEEFVRPFRPLNGTRE